MERDEILKHRVVHVRWPSARARNALVNDTPEGTLGDLIQLNSKELLRIPGLSHSVGAILLVLLHVGGHEAKAGSERVGSEAPR
jgi:hypothetical protein